MDRSKLQILLNDRLLNKTEHICGETRDKIMKDMHDFHNKHGIYEDVIVAMEEMAELIQVLSKVKRGKMGKDDIGVMEEIADVRLCMYEIAMFVFDLPMETLNDRTSLLISKDFGPSGYTYDAAVVAMSRMSNLSHKLGHIISGKKRFSNKSLLKGISKVNASMLALIAEYDIDLEKIRHIEDIKMERTKERLKNGTN